jgi:hypothetical protein
MLASTTATVVPAAISAVSGLAGVLVGSYATTRRDRQARDDAARRELRVAALRCLARARKLEGAEGESLDAEYRYLGTDLDDYVAAIAGAPDRHERRTHWLIYEQTRPILMRHELDELEAVIGSLEAVREELMTELREETRP